MVVCMGIIGSNIRTTRMHIDPITNEGKREQNGMVALVEERIEAVDADAPGISTAKLLHFIEVELLANENTKRI
jgi:hypothetical protein